MKFNNTNIFQCSMLLVALLLLSLLSACGGGAAGGAGPAGSASDTTAPITTVAPAVSGTSGTATTLSVTINENGTGYYLVLPFAASAPTSAAVQTGTAFSMTANVAATPAISGLTPVTPYMIYFVAKDAANNVQAAVQSVPVSTTAVPDTTAPITMAAPAVSGTSGTATTLSVTINENGTGYYLVLPAAAATPTSAAVQAGTSFAMTANVTATPSISGLTPVTAYMIYFVAKDAANNVQAAVQSVSVTTIPGYVVQGGLTWMPVLTSANWTNANSYCANTPINGQTGWRMPTTTELSSLYASGLMNGKGWALNVTWSSVGGFPFSYYDTVNLSNAAVSSDIDTNSHMVSCVR